MQTMYPGKVNSPQTELASAIDDEQTTIPLLDASVLPDPPNLATIGTGEDAETVLYTGIDGNDLTGVTRGFQGQAKSWSAGVKVARLYTAYDHDAFIENINSHASRHAAGGPDEITPEMIGAETPDGAQEKADQVKSYVDGNFPRVIRLPINQQNVTYVKVAELDTDVGTGNNSLIIYVNGTSSISNNSPGMDMLQVSTRGGVGLRAYTLLPQGYEGTRYGYVNNSSTGKTEIWIRRDTYQQSLDVIVAQSRGADVGVLAQQTTEPSGITYVNKDAFATKTQESWINATLLNSWVNYGSGWAPASYFKDQFGIVRLRGMIRNGTVTQGTTILILPSGYRPASDISFLVPSGDGTSDTLGRLVVDTSGNVRVSSASNYYLDLSGISFRTA